jgi:hypothetical protein
VHGSPSYHHDTKERLVVFYYFAGKTHFESGGGPPQSKTLRAGDSIGLSRQRLGLRQPWRFKNRGNSELCRISFAATPFPKPL